MKKLFYLAIFVFFGCLPFTFAQQSAPAQNTTQLASQMMSAYDDGFYPGVVRFADEILLQNSNSPVEVKAFLLKAESLLKMGRIQESLDFLQSGQSLVNKNEEARAECFFWTGRAYFELNKNEESLSCFYNSAEIIKKIVQSKNEKETFQKNVQVEKLYADSLFYAGKVLRRLENFKTAGEYFEYVIQNGNIFSVNDFEDAAVNFFECSVLSEQFAKCEEYYPQVKNFEFSNDGKYRILLAYAQALEGLKKYDQAYDLYVQVLSSGPDSLCAIAMQRAYLISSSNPSAVSGKTDSLMERASALKEKNPQLISEFWTRLAIDEFNSKNYEKSLLYFNNAKENSSVPLKQLALIYSTEIKFLTSKKTEKQAAFECLSLLENGWKDCNFVPDDFFYADAMVAKARYSAICGDWKKTLEFASPQIQCEKSPGVKKSAVYWTSLALYSTDQYKECLQIMENFPYQDDDFLILKAKALAKNGNSSGADAIFYELSEKGSLNNDGRLDYIRTLLNAGHLYSTVEQANAASGAEAFYMKGLAFFNRHEWKNAENAFSSAITQKNDRTALAENYSKLSYFYLGYCQYQLESYENAFKNFSVFIKGETESSLKWLACVTASRCAVQISKKAEAVESAGLALKIAKDEGEIHESVLLLSGIYTDFADFDRALEVLKPYSSQNDDFGNECLYLLAQVYVQKKDFTKADSCYKTLSEQNSSPELAQEALFRRGELFYTNEKYSKAIPLFESYMKNYFEGKFFDAAMYFEADSLLKTGKTEKASLYFMQIIQNYGDSTYKYAARKNMVELFRQNGEYSAALQMAQKMMQEYGSQAQSDGIPAMEKELKALASGADKEILEKEIQYENSGFEKTAESRIAGTELVKLYAKSLNFTKAEKLAVQLLKIQEKNEAEVECAFENAQFLAGLYRNQNKKEISAQMFLKAAQFARKCGKNEEASRCLYGAAESFDAAKKTGDAKSTVELLQKLYPQSTYATDSKNLLK